MKFLDISLAIQEVEGVETLKFHLGTMKNMQGTLAKVGTEPYMESILPCLDKRFCAIKAHKRMILATSKQAMLFNGSIHSRKLSATQA